MNTTTNRNQYISYSADVAKELNKVELSVVISQLHYHTIHRPAFKGLSYDSDGLVWIERTYEEWQELFCTWSVSTLRRYWSILKRMGLVKIIQTGRGNRFALTPEGLALFEADEPETHDDDYIDDMTVVTDVDVHADNTVIEYAKNTSARANDNHTTPAQSEQSRVFNLNSQESLSLSQSEQSDCSTESPALYIYIPVDTEKSEIPERDKDAPLSKGDQFENLPATSTDPLNPDDYITAFCELCDYNPQLASNRNKVRRFAIELMEAGYTFEDMACVKRLRKHEPYFGNFILPSQVVEVIERAIMQYPDTDKIVEAYYNTHYPQQVVEEIESDYPELQTLSNGRMLPPPPIPPAPPSTPEPPEPVDPDDQRPEIAPGNRHYQFAHQEVNAACIDAVGGNYAIARKRFPTLEVHDLRDGILYLQVKDEATRQQILPHMESFIEHLWSPLNYYMQYMRCSLVTGARLLTYREINTGDITTLDVPTFTVYDPSQGPTPATKEEQAKMTARELFEYGQKMRAPFKPRKR